MNEKEIIFYESKSGKKPFQFWFKSMDKKIKERILARLDRIEQGNFGDYKYIDDDIYELKFNFGSGYRIYFAQDGDAIVILLCGGDKSSQSQDIEKAKNYFKDFKERIDEKQIKITKL